MAETPVEAKKVPNTEPFPEEVPDNAEEAPECLRERSEDPRAVYMRRYREERRGGAQKPPRDAKISTDSLTWAREQRNLGRTYRSIATELGVDHSYLARRIKAE